MSDKIREAFEAFADGHSVLEQYSHKRYPFQPELYDAIPLQSAWDSWQAAIAQQHAPVAVPDALPYWEPCNPGCDPEFNGFRTRHCDCAEAKAAQANTPAAPVAVEQEPVAWGAYVNGDLITGSQAYVQRERDEYEATCIDDPDFVHEVALPLYTAPPAAEQPDTVKVSRELLVDALLKEALNLCDAVENVNDLPPVKYALQAGRAVNKVRDASAALLTGGEKP